MGSLFLLLTLQAADQPKVTILKGHTRPVMSVAFSPEGKLLASAAKDKTVKIWSVANKKEMRSLTYDFGLNWLSFASDGHRLAAMADDAIVIWDISTGEQLVV